jgi:hypothetical protein
MDASEIKINAVLPTDGSGLWSDVAKGVRVTKLRLRVLESETNGQQPDFGELRVHFDRRTWRIDQHGLIYTDGLFLSGLRPLLNSIGLAGRDVDYSEQGMQCDDYVSCDDEGEFISSWIDYHLKIAFQSKPFAVESGYISLDMGRPGTLHLVRGRWLPEYSEKYLTGASPNDRRLVQWTALVSHTLSSEVG